MTKPLALRDAAALRLAFLSEPERTAPVIGSGRHQAPGLRLESIGLGAVAGPAGVDGSSAASMCSALLRMSSFQRPGWPWAGSLVSMKSISTRTNRSGSSRRGKWPASGKNVVAALEAERDAIAEQLAPCKVGDLVRLHDDDDDTPACRVVAVEYYTEHLEVSDPEVWDEVPLEPTYVITLDRMARSPEGHSEPDTYTADEIYLVDQLASQRRCAGPV